MDALNTTKPKVLVVDDNHLVSEAMQMILENAGFEVVLAGNAGKAILYMDVVPLNLIITDIVMPDMDGLEFIRSIRRRNQIIPIVAISGMGPSDGRLYLALAEKEGASEVLTKPVDRTRLLEVANRLTAYCH